ncbi:hypothetical protein A3E89_01965 [Candidatus Campbellbacteria bacterium RIFCSPHIGHO2_12_FULL_35_10]|uniref:Uncharacterized protein n=1 Tax=Candidatus Campbellbacteria bacterium RIFCSPHIGHO2_12_FULL_35_10 TaxID=1797578 RepID=A0A1F5ER23_9BACT|nr:MAG: hypothetical protein A3E89_01965 [Candidatus Campbellbacteria bacterium RIFCSPHIGHO2_12_FULL_35_10]
MLDNFKKRAKLHNYINCITITVKEGNMVQKTIEELEAILDQEEEIPIEILPNGEIRARNQTDSSEIGGKKPLTMREDLGGEY